MPVTVVVGGQFGSEGKGKVAYLLAIEQKAAFAVRVGGPNSGHTVVITGNDVPVILRHLPTACLLPNVTSVIPPGSYLNVPLLLQEIAMAGLRPGQVLIDGHAWLVLDSDRDTEQRMSLAEAIGSTGSGTGAAVLRRVSRQSAGTFARDVAALEPYIANTGDLLAHELSRGARIIVEGTQGFGLSLLHSGAYPQCTSRDTTAASFLSEAGLSPVDVDDIVLVIRAHPIRVAGNSGPLHEEVTWQTVTAESGSPNPLLERTSVTQKIRRIGRFEPDVVIRAINHNHPTRIVLNHTDYIDFNCRVQGRLTMRAAAFVDGVEEAIGRGIDLVGFSPSSLHRRDGREKRAANA